MSKWKMVRLGDVCEIVLGSTPKTNVDEYWNGEIKWITPAEIEENAHFISDTERHLTELGRKSAGLRIMPRGTVLLSTRAPIGKVAIISEEMCCNQGFKNFICSPEIHNNYIYYFLKNKTEYLNSLGNGATFKEISKKIVEEIKIPLPPLDEQKRIADVLDKASELITKRKEQIRLMDELSKSLFIEMFGDPVENPMGWEIWQLREITDKIGSGATPKGGKESYISTGIALVRSMNIYNGSFKYDALAHITEEQAKQLEIVTLKENDVLINITGASVARSCIIPREILPARVNQHVSIIRCKPDKVTSKFINQMLINTSYQDLLLGIGRGGGATREAITKQQLEFLPIPLPPLSLQQEFADRINAIEQQKALLQNGLAKMETAYKALMQEYFG